MTERTVPEKAVMLVDETLDDEEGEHCDDLMDVAAADDRAELFVAFAADATDRIGFGAVGMGRQPAKRGIVVVGETVGAPDDPDFTDPLAEASVSSASDLRDLGQTISQCCQAWHDQDHEIGVCFDGLADLLDANDAEAVFQFLHVLTNRLESVGATTHVHVDPDRLVPTNSGRASDDDVANAVGGDGNSRSERSTGEASDDDIADALPD